MADENKLTDEVKGVITEGMKGIQEKLKGDIDAAITKYEGQVGENGKASNEARAEVKALGEKFEAAMADIAKKMDNAPSRGVEQKSAAVQFTESEQFKAFVAGERDKARVEVKNTVTSLAAANTTFALQQPGVIPGAFTPLTVREAFNQIPVSQNAVSSIREASWVNSAAETTQATGKKESDLTFEKYDVVIQTVAHFIKVTNQLLQDAPAVVAYINTRLRDGLAQRIDKQLIVGDGTPPNLSGLTDSGNYTAYSLAASDDTLTDGINKAKYAMWAATGVAPDTAFVNPADWGAMERSRESATGGAYLYGVPGMNAGTNPFGIRIVLSNNVVAGNIIVAALAQAATLYVKQSAVIEMGYVNTDFTDNLVTLRAEERLGLGVERPSLVYYGDFES